MFQSSHDMFHVMKMMAQQLYSLYSHSLVCVVCCSGRSVVVVPPPSPAEFYCTTLQHVLFYFQRQWSWSRQLNWS